NERAVEYEPVVSRREIPLQIQRSQTFVIQNDRLKSEQMRVAKAITIVLRFGWKIRFSRIFRIAREEQTLFRVQRGTHDQPFGLQCGKNFCRIFSVVERQSSRTVRSDNLT